MKFNIWLIKKQLHIKNMVTKSKKQTSSMDENRT